MIEPVCGPGSVKDKKKKKKKRSPAHIGVRTTSQPKFD